MLAVLVVVVAVVLVVVLTGPDAPPPPAGALGDQRTADPCSVLSVPALAALGRVRVFDDYGDLSSCLAQVDGPRGSQQVTATFVVPVEYTAGTAVRREGDVTVTTFPPADSSCSRVLVLPGGEALAVRSDLVSGVDPCAGADAAAQAAAPLLAARAVGRRAANPGGALTSLDACGLVDPAALGSIPGLDAGRRGPGFGGWECLVGYNPAFTNAPYASVTISRSTPLTGAPFRLGRHYAQATPAAAAATAAASCSVSIVQRAYAGSSGGARTEVVRIGYSGTGAQTPQDVCRDATTVATGIEARMPAPGPGA